jgi:hypothetical protein
MERRTDRRTWLFHWAFYGMINGCLIYVSSKDFRHILAHNETQSQISYHSRHFKRSIVTGRINYSPQILSDFLKEDFKINGTTPLLRFAKINTLVPLRIHGSCSRIPLLFLSPEFVTQWLIFCRHYFCKWPLKKRMYRELCFQFPPR